MIAVYSIDPLVDARCDLTNLEYVESLFASIEAGHVFCRHEPFFEIIFLELISRRTLLQPPLAYFLFA